MSPAAGLCAFMQGGCATSIWSTCAASSLIRDDGRLRFERGAMQWLSRYAAEGRQLRLGARELVDSGGGRREREQARDAGRQTRFGRAAASFTYAAWPLYP